MMTLRGRQRGTFQRLGAPNCWRDVCRARGAQFFIVESNSSERFWPSLAAYPENSKGLTMIDTMLSDAAYYLRALTRDGRPVAARLP
jgi:hypothetical protein